MACAVIRAQSRKECAPESWGNARWVLSERVVPLPELPPSGSKAWAENQRADSSLSELWDEGLPVDKVRDGAPGHLVQGDLLVPKWAPL